MAQWLSAHLLIERLWVQIQLDVGLFCSSSFLHHSPTVVCHLNRSIEEVQHNRFFREKMPRCVKLGLIQVFFKDVPFPASFSVWIQTMDLWCRKRPLYQLSHNHCHRGEPSLMCVVHAIDQEVTIQQLSVRGCKIKTHKIISTIDDELLYPILLSYLLLGLAKVQQEEPMPHENVENLAPKGLQSPFYRGMF